MNRRVLIVIIMSILLVTTIVLITIFCSKTKNIFIQVVNKTITMYVENSFCVKSEQYLIYADNINENNIVFSSDNPNIVNVNTISGDVISLNKGTAKIKVFYRVDDKLVFNCEILVSVLETPTYPTSINFENTSLICNPNSQITNNYVIVGEYNQQLEVISSNPSIAEFDLTTKKIIAKNVGECDISIKVGDIVDTCHVKVSEMIYLINIQDQIVVSNISIVNYTITINDSPYTGSIELEYDDTLIAVNILSNSLKIQRLRTGTCNLVIKLINSNVEKTVLISCP